MLMLVWVVRVVGVRMVVVMMNISHGVRVVVLMVVMAVVWHQAEEERLTILDQS